MNPHPTASDLRRRVARGVARSSALGVVAAAALLSSPAYADVPRGWSEPEDVAMRTVLWMLVGIPAGLFLLITLLVYVPSLIRGEKTAPAGAIDTEWFGGPVKGTDELPAPDDATSKAGGARGRW